MKARPLLKRGSLALGLMLLGCPSGGSGGPPPPAASAEVPLAAPGAQGARIAGSKLAEDDRLGRLPAPDMDPDDTLPPPSPKTPEGGPPIPSAPPDAGGVEL